MSKQKAYSKADQPAASGFSLCLPLAWPHLARTSGIGKCRPLHDCPAPVRPGPEISNQKTRALQHRRKKAVTWWPTTTIERNGTG